MANRSDFMGTLPRSIRRTLLMGRAYGIIKDDAQLAEMRALFVRAHKHYKDIKLNRSSFEKAPSKDTNEEAG